MFHIKGQVVYPRLTRQQQAEDALGPLEQRCGNTLDACKDKLRRFFQTRYGAASWSKERLVIARVEASWQGTDVRFIVTNLLGGRSKHLYEKVYCVRGKMENLLLGHASIP